MKLVYLGLLLSTGIYTSGLPAQDDLEKSIARGKAIYTENCITCHMGDGAGVPDVFPPLAGSDYLMDSAATGLSRAIRSVKFGLEGPIRVNGKSYDNVMPAPGLNDKEVADVMNYIRNTWGNNAKKKVVTEKMVKETRPAADSTELIKN